MESTYTGPQLCNKAENSRLETAEQLFLLNLAVASVVDRLDTLIQVIEEASAAQAKATYTLGGP